MGDRHAAIDEAVNSLQPLLDMSENDAAEGRDIPHPPGRAREPHH